MRTFFAHGAVAPLVALALALSTTSASSAQPPAPTGLMCNFQKHPALGVTAAPQFTWAVPSCVREGGQPTLQPRQPVVQSAYQITVTNAVTGEPAWDSGKVESSSSTGVGYGGPALAAGSAYNWTVSTWSPSCQSESAKSSPATFITALFGAGGWAPSAAFIWPGKATKSKSSSMFAFFRKVVAVPAGKPVAHARYAVARACCARQVCCRASLLRTPANRTTVVALQLWQLWQLWWLVVGVVVVVVCVCVCVCVCTHPGKRRASFNLVCRSVPWCCTPWAWVAGLVCVDRVRTGGSIFVTAVTDDVILCGYKLYIDGQLVNVGPGRGEARVWGGDGAFNAHPYTTLDVTGFLPPPGSSALIAVQSVGCDACKGSSMNQGFLMQLNMQRADGSVVTVATDSSWSAFAADVYIKPSPGKNWSVNGSQYHNVAVKHFQSLGLSHFLDASAASPHVLYGTPHVVPQQHERRSETTSSPLAATNREPNGSRLRRQHQWGASTRSGTRADRVLTAC